MAAAGVGVDIIEIDRMREVINRTPRFLTRVFTDYERAYAERRANPYASYAGFFAAREAVLKALGVGFSDGVSFTDVSVVHDERGKPMALLAGRAAQIAQSEGVTEVFLSVSHTRELAVANALAATSATQVKRVERIDERALVAQQFKAARSLLDDLDAREGDG